MSEYFQMELSSPITDEEWAIITDAELERTSEITFNTPSGKKVVFIKKPTVDAVEVVRCKDCKHRPAFRYDDRYVEGPRYQETLKNGLTVTLEDTRCPCVNGLDSYFSYVPKDDWFCANGERSEDNED